MAAITRRQAAALLCSAALIPGRVLAADPIRVGMAISQSGSLADSAEHYRRGIELWRDGVNARGGLLGRPVEIVLYDDRTDAATAARLYERLIVNDGVDLLISPLGSATTAAGSAVAEKHKRVFINAGGASESIQSRGFKYVFQTAAPITAYVDGLGPLATKHGLKTLAFITRDFGAARDLRKSLDTIAKQYGLEIVMTEYVPPGTTDYSSSVARARQTNPDMWVSTGYANEAIEMVRQFHSVDYLPKLFLHPGVAQPDFVRALGRDSEFSFGMSLYEPSLKTAGNEAFAKTYRERYGYDPSYYAGFAFAGGTVLEAAVKAAGSIDQERLRDVLTTLQVDTPMGHHRVDPATGMQVGIKGLVVQIRDGANAIVYPDDLKSADAVIPMPPWNRR